MVENGRLSGVKRIRLQYASDVSEDSAIDVDTRHFELCIYSDDEWESFALSYGDLAYLRNVSVQLHSRSGSFGLVEKLDTINPEILDLIRESHISLSDLTKVFIAGYDAVRETYAPQPLKEEYASVQGILYNGDHRAPHNID